MIYILAGNDIRKRSIYIKGLTKDRDLVLLSPKELSKELLRSYALGVSLFGDLKVVVIENILLSNEASFSNEDLKILKDSPTIFIFLEDKILVAVENKYKKYAEILRFDEKVTAKIQKINTFALADTFGSCDKIKSWVLYREAVESGIEPEALSGILFWKIKTMLLNGSKVFSSDRLKKQSSEIVSLYHRAHRGEIDFVVGLEQFILSSLSK